MAAESQQRLRSLLAAYNVLSAKQRHNKVHLVESSLAASHASRKQCCTWRHRRLCS